MICGPSPERVRRSRCRPGFVALTAATSLRTISLHGGPASTASRQRFPHRAVLRMRPSLLYVAILCSGLLACEKGPPAPVRAPVVPTPAVPIPRASTPVQTVAITTPPSSDAIGVRSSSDRPSVALLNGPCPLPGERLASCPVQPSQPSQRWKAAQVVIGWRGSLPGEGVQRSQEQARTLAITLGHRARRADADFMAMVWRYSDDPQPAIFAFGAADRVRYVPQFTELVESMSVDNVDVTRSRFGYHVIRRVGLEYRAPDRPARPVLVDACPLPGEVSAACPRSPEPGETMVVVQHILVGYKGAVGRHRGKRSRSKARQLAVTLAHAARRADANFEALMNRHSDDPGEGSYEITEQGDLDRAFMVAARQLSVGNIDVVETGFGYHVIRRIR